MAEWINARCRQADIGCDRERLQAALDLLFSAGDGEQRRAALTVATRPFAVISGGPGTGKTFTIARIILLLQMLHGSLRFSLAAPTGKAAARLQEAVEAAIGAMGERYGRIPVELQTQTLHRLLGYNPLAGRFRYGADRPLPSDAVIVDEASMIDLELMHQLMQAVPPHARLVLVGDKDQLASVEAGAVLGDICYGLSAIGIRKAVDCVPSGQSSARSPATFGYDAPNRRLGKKLSLWFAERDRCAQPGHSSVRCARQHSRY